MENNIVRRNTINPLKIAKASWKYGSFVYVFLFMFIFYCAINKHINWGGIMTILTHTAVVGTIALGMGLIIISGEIDLSVGSIFAFSGGLGILTYNEIVKTMHNTGLAMFITFIVIVALSALIGFINGFMVGKIKMPAFIATLGTMLIFRSLCKYILKSIPVEGGGQQQTYQIFEYFDSPFYTLGNEKLITIPIVGIVFILLAILVFYFAKHTKFGRKVYALGSNPKASSLAGINVPMSKVAIFTIAGALVGIAAFLHTGIYGSMDSSTAGMSYELYAIASCVIGGIAMTGGRGNIIGIIFGALSFQIIDKIISVANLNPLINDTIKGAILLVAVVLQVVVIDKTAVKKYFQHIGLAYNPHQDQVLEGELRKKVNNVKLTYDKRFQKILRNKNIQKEEAESIINGLLDKREAKIVALNNKYDILMDNARLKQKEMTRKLAIKEAKSNAKKEISDLRYAHKVALKACMKENKPLMDDALKLMKANANELYNLQIGRLNEIHQLEQDVTVLNENAKHLLERTSNQAVYDKTIANIETYLAKEEETFAKATGKANSELEKTMSKVQALEIVTNANKDVLLAKREEVVTKREAKAAKKAIKDEAKKAKHDENIKHHAEVQQEMQNRKDYLDSILKSRGMR